MTQSIRAVRQFLTQNYPGLHFTHVRHYHTFFALFFRVDKVPPHSLWPELSRRFSARVQPGHRVGFIEVQVPRVRVFTWSPKQRVIASFIVLFLAVTQYYVQTKTTPPFFDVRSFLPPEGQSSDSPETPTFPTRPTPVTESTCEPTPSDLESHSEADTVPPPGTDTQPRKSGEEPVATPASATPSTAADSDATWTLLSLIGARPASKVV